MRNVAFPRRVCPQPAQQCETARFRGGFARSPRNNAKRRVSAAGFSEQIPNTNPQMRECVRARPGVFTAARSMGREQIPTEQQPHDGVLLLVEKMLVRAQRAQQGAARQVHGLVPALQLRLQKTDERMRARSETEVWLPEAREAKMNPMEYMDRCNRFLCKLDTMGWKRSFHQNLFHAASARAL
jgi:hypothetical protein